MKAEFLLEKEYHENGNLMFEVYQNEDGIPEGEWKSYHENGKLREIGFIKDGKEQGEYKTYWENGNLSSIGFIKDGKQDGEWKRYHYNGELLVIGSYKDGKQDGEWKTYNKFGDLYVISHFVLGHNHRTHYYNIHPSRYISLSRFDYLKTVVFTADQQELKELIWKTYNDYNLYHRSSYYLKKELEKSLSKDFQSLSKIINDNFDLWIKKCEEIPEDDPYKEDYEDEIETIRYLLELVDGNYCLDGDFVFNFFFNICDDCGIINYCLNSKTDINSDPEVLNYIEEQRKKGWIWDSSKKTFSTEISNKEVR